MAYGLSPNVLDREVNYLLASRCVIAEHLRLESVEDEDLIRLGPAGFVHLDLIGNVSYLAALAEDTYFFDRLQAERVGERIRDAGKHLHLQTTVDNATEVVEYLEELRAKVLPPNGSFLADNMLSMLTDIEDATAALNRVKRNLSWDPWFDARKRMPRGSVLSGVVVNVREFGCFVELPDGLHGLVHISKMGGHDVGLGDRVEVNVIWIDAVQKKIALALVSVIEEDAGDIAFADAPR